MSNWGRFNQGRCCEQVEPGINCELFADPNLWEGTEASIIFEGFSGGCMETEGFSFILPFNYFSGLGCRDNVIADNLTTPFERRANVGVFPEAAIFCVSVLFSCPPLLEQRDTHCVVYGTYNAIGQFNNVMGHRFQKLILLADLFNVEHELPLVEFGHLFHQCGFHTHTQPAPIMRLTVTKPEE